ncbi:hypothetical protein BLS_008286 [Venturia inaequalis]|uniref:U6 small nuclear RNA (adenine-(43)-N(6))-methyltransferase n=1 Tax=Venturia inaequalis TaxID=5025 RepID=A0A8H3YP02_VENIN|nr:hypothetical protein BLS_008286 [Venturia inaequalis]RDI77102.1 hypothetical protein Vi05172_g12874 [Venturia inaequalis]
MANSKRRNMPNPIPAKPFEPPNYDDKLDFEEIALKDPDFAHILSSNNGIFDFHKPEHMLQLTNSLLKRDFRLRLKVPNDRLCPPVPIRWSYVQWIQGLIDSTSDKYYIGYDPSRQVTGIDVGVGSSCIYPLLACTARRNWKFIGTDIDDTNFDHAAYNTRNNGLDQCIRLVKTLPHEPFWDLKKLKIEKADFTMCNPPFFASNQERLSTFDKDSPPHAICTGAEVEMVTRGGELAFVLSMVEESRSLGTKIQWFTSQLGKVASLPIIVRQLRQHGCSNWAVGILNQNARTRRWVIGWSWCDLKPSKEVARNQQVPVLQMWPTEYSIWSQKYTKEALVSAVDRTLSDLDLDWSYDPESLTGLGTTKGDVWSRAARRKRKMELQEMSTTESSANSAKTAATMSSPMTSTDEAIPEMVFRVSISTAEDTVHLRWLKGVDSVLWDSFCGMMRRKLTDNIAAF